MKCQKCGHEFEGKFCPECGTPVAAPAAEPAAPALAPVETKKPKKKPLSQGCGCAIVLTIAFFVILAIALIGGSSTISTSATAETATSTTEPTAIPSATEEPASVEASPSTYEATSESMQQLFTDSFDFDYSNLSCLVEDENGLNVCTITYKDDEAAWDESAVVRKVLSTFIDFQRLAYEIDGIDAIRFKVLEDMVDDRGNASPEQVFTFMMDKETCQLYNWESMSGRSILSQLQRDCKEFYIAPGIYNQVNSDDVIYHSLYFPL